MKDNDNINTFLARKIDEIKKGGYKMQEQPNHSDRQRRRRARLLLFSLLFVWLIGMPMQEVSAQTTSGTGGTRQIQDVGQSDKDHKDASSQKVVRVGYVNAPGYEEGLEGEYKTGAGYEYLQKISYYTGWKYEYVYGSFKDLYDMLVKGEIDLFGNVSYTEERAKLFNFSTYTQGRDGYYIYTTKERTDLLTGDLTSLNGITVGVTENSFQETLLKDWMKKNNLKIKIKKYDGYDSSMVDMEKGVVDAIATPKLAASYEYAVIIDMDSAIIISQ